MTRRKHAKKPARIQVAEALHERVDKRGEHLPLRMSVFTLCDWLGYHPSTVRTAFTQLVNTEGWLFDKTSPKSNDYLIFRLGPKTVKEISTITHLPKDLVWGWSKKQPKEQEPEPEQEVPEQMNSALANRSSVVVFKLVNIGDALKDFNLREAVVLEDTQGNLYLNSPHLGKVEGNGEEERGDAADASVTPG